jgi:hypothetical protein
VNQHDTGGESLVCVDCGEDFIFTGGERRFYDERGLTTPRRCPACRAQRRQEREREDAGRTSASPETIDAPRGA